VAPSDGGVAGDVHVDFHHQLRVDERDLQDVAAAPPGGERPPRPRVLAADLLVKPQYSRAALFTAGAEPAIACWWPNSPSEAWCMVLGE